MKKILFVLIFVLVLCSVSATDYTNYKGLNLVYSIDSEFNSIITGQDPRILEAEAIVKLFPREDFEGQELRSFDIDSEPDAQTDMNDVLRFEWDSMLVDRFFYKLDARVRTTNRFVKINRKISFPHVFDDSGLNKYIEATEFIDINEDIRNTAKNVIGDEDDYYIVVGEIANWVKQNVNYDLNTVTESAVQKSSWVLENKQGVCDELTNLFISMLRSLGIPARFVSGTAYTSLSDDWGNHGWAEVYFPGFGWINYDVTYGQYGWIDASHLKLSDTYDSGESSVDYTWRVRDLEIEVGDLGIKTQFGSYGNKMDEQLLLEIKPLYKEVGFGSFVPIEVIVTNQRNYYVSESISLVKAPKMLNAVNKILWFKPNEVKSIYWIVEIPDNLDKDYVFNALLEVRGSFGESAKSSIGIFKDAKVYTYDEVVKREYELEHRGDKKSFKDLDVECVPGEKQYYSNEEIIVSCKLVNNNANTLDLKVCLDNDCDEFTLNVDEVKNVRFLTEGVGKKVVVVESENFIKYNNVDVEIVEVPDIYISDMRPKEISYDEKVKLTFVLNSDFKAYDAQVDVVGFDMIDLGNFKGEQVVNMEISGKDLLKGMNLKMIYYDVKGKEYFKDEVYYIDVLGIPWYRKILMFFGV